MKNNLVAQYSNGTNSTLTGQTNDLFYPVSPDSLGKQGRLKKIVNNFTDVNLFKNPNPVSKSFPDLETGNYNAKNMAGKRNGNEIEQSPYFNIFIKEAAARLSDIEMAIYNYDVSNLQFSTHTLKSLFFNMRMPTACHMMDKMEELAKENKIREVNNLFLNLKKIIGQIVQHNREIKDC